MRFLAGNVPWNDFCRQNAKASTEIQVRQKFGFVIVARG
jgi:hypothetical protein